MEYLWLIWSNEHGSWWMPNGSGYTSSRAQAGRYSFDDAIRIVQGANEYHNNDTEAPYETMVRDY